ncbi:hypothetical protein [Streptomyces sp. NBC_00046]|uniref:hypothetical protein n=1 Tax=unclassified Streptomyces TaxID=2593676 RepID=UPI003868CE17
MLALLPDGSYLTRIGGLPLRVIEAEIHSRTADGGDFGGTYRLLTTLNDHRTDPADHLVRLYHERWGATRSRTRLSELPDRRIDLMSTA